MLVCRVLLGRILYNDEIYPNAQECINQCVREGGYNSVVGDREKCRGTYREMVVYDNDLIYPEFLVWYKRIFN